jgi:hypothetical protein
MRKEQYTKKNLAHETGDNAVERGALVAEAFLASAERTEVLGSLGAVPICVLYACTYMYIHACMRVHTYVYISKQSMPA